MPFNFNRKIVNLLCTRYLGSFNAKMSPMPLGDFISSSLLVWQAVPSMEVVKFHLGMPPAFNKL